MITIKTLLAVHAKDHFAHAVWTQIEGESDPKLSTLSNQFAIPEQNNNFESANQQYKQWLQETVTEQKGSAYSEIATLTKAELLDLDVTIYARPNTAHAQTLAAFLSSFVSQCTVTEQPTHAAATTAQAMRSCMEPVIGYQEFEPEPFENPDPKPPTADDYDINLFNVVWVREKTQSLLAYALDDHNAIIPTRGSVALKPFTFRFAKHKIGKMPHVQAELAAAYNEHYNQGDANWTYEGEQVKIAEELNDNSNGQKDTDIDSYNGHFFYSDLEDTDAIITAQNAVADATDNATVRDYDKGLIPEEQPFNKVQPITITRANGSKQTVTRSAQIEAHKDKKPITKTTPAKVVWVHGRTASMLGRMAQNKFHADVPQYGKIKLTANNFKFASAYISAAF